MLPRQIIALTPPDLRGAEEAIWIGQLLRLGLCRVHIRKPGASKEALMELLEAIPWELRRRCVLSHHVDLVREFGLGGVHLSVSDWRGLSSRPEGLRPDQLVGVSCHSRAELEALPFTPSYAYLSPVAPSLSKAGYGATGAWSEEELIELCRSYPFPLIALGGIHPDNANSFLRRGFSAVASLGYSEGLRIHELERALRHLCQPTILFCGGLDPTAEAGITADARHAERLGARCYTVATALTRQDAHSFYGCTSVTEEDLVGQLEALSQQRPPEVAKIGLVTSLGQVLTLTKHLRRLFPTCLIIWDPILRTSSGYSLLSDSTPESLHQAIGEVDLLLPNAYEREVLFGGIPPQEVARHSGTILLCKSAQEGSDGITDIAYLPDGVEIRCTAPATGQDRHGTGCLYASELAVALARGEELGQAMGRAQRSVGCYRSGCMLPKREEQAHLGRRMFVTHGRTSTEILQQAERVLRLGLADIVQLRMKGSDWETILDTARDLQALCRSFGVPLIINDHVDIAALISADGVHLGKEDMSPTLARRLLGPSALIGRTCNSQEDLDKALAFPVDYIGLGPFRFTKTKEKLAPQLGLEGYRRLKLHHYPLPVYAIGGIRLEDAPALYTTGIYGLAMSGGLIEAPDIPQHPSNYHSNNTNTTDPC